MITGKKTSLRAIEPSDANSYHKWINDPETNYWRGLYHPTNEAQAQDFIEKQAVPSADRLSLAIETTEGQLAGLVGLRNICARSRRAEVWIYLGAKEHWGGGLGTDAIASLCSYAFEQMNLHRIWLECEPANIGAVRCYEKNGFQQEGLLRDGYYRHGQYRDTIMMALLRTDWQKPS